MLGDSHEATMLKFGDLGAHWEAYLSLCCQLRSRHHLTPPPPLSSGVRVCHQPRSSRRLNERHLPQLGAVQLPGRARRADPGRVRRHPERRALLLPVLQHAGEAGQEVRDRLPQRRRGAGSETDWLPQEGGGEINGGMKCSLTVRFCVVLFGSGSPFCCFCVRQASSPRASIEGWLEILEFRHYSTTSQCNNTACVMVMRIACTGVSEKLRFHFLCRRLYALLFPVAADRWQMTGMWDRLEARKPVLCEPRRGDEFEDMMRQFRLLVESGDDTGALLMAVCRGKLSEGIDFSDDSARAVITVSRCGARCMLSYSLIGTCTSRDLILD